MKKLWLFLLPLIITGCTSVKVDKVDAAQYQIEQICIEENKRVIFDEFLTVIRARIELHGIKTEVYEPSQLPNSCEYRLWYTALRTWDIATYLSHAELKLYKENTLIGQAIYHLKGKGGLALTKWASVATKMNPVVDELLDK